MLRVVEPEEMLVIHELAQENPDLRVIPGELRQLRALRAAQTAPAPLRPASFRELLKGVEAGILSADEARLYLGLPARRGTLERVLAWLRRPLQVVVRSRIPAPAPAPRAS